MSWILDNLDRIGIAVSDEQWFTCTQNFVERMKEQFPQGIIKFEDHLMELPLNGKFYDVVIKKSGGSWVRDQDDFVYGFRFDGGPEIVSLELSGFDIGARRARKDKKENTNLRGIPYWTGWKHYVEFCPFQPNTEEYAGWWSGMDFIGDMPWEIANNLPEKYQYWKQDWWKEMFKN
jgi:hypothetical protein